jgi:hypothetical protein
MTMQKMSLSKRLSPWAMAFLITLAVVTPFTGLISMVRPL